MSRERDKQVDEALAAIRKLVEGEDKPASHVAKDDGIVTLDKVVWRNPAKDKTADDEPATADVPENLIPDRGSDPHPSGKEASLSAKAAPLKDLPASDNAAQPATQKRPFASAGSISPHDIALITELKKPIARKGDALFAQDTSSLAEDAPAWPQQLPSMSAKREDDTAHAEEAADGLSAPQQSEPPHQTQDLKAQDIQVHDIQVHDIVAQPAGAPPIETPEPVALTEVVDVNPFAVPGREDPSLDIPVAPPVNKVTGDQDFTFAAAESLMTPASLRELSEPFSPIEPTPVEIAVQPEAVADPVAEVQRMYEDEAVSSPIEDEISPYSQPNLHVVSDQTSYDQDEDEAGFSGAVRSALRSIIKEQVSHWLHDNMTDLIEDALSGPAKPARQAPARKTKPIRRDK